MKTMGTLGMLVGIVAMASPALGSTHHVNCDVPGQTITKQCCGRHQWAARRRLYGP
jgi:hypothetical protein